MIRSAASDESIYIVIARGAGATKSLRSCAESCRFVVDCDARVCCRRKSAELRRPCRRCMCSEKPDELGRLWLMDEWEGIRGPSSSELSPLTRPSTLRVISSRSSIQDRC